MEREDDVIDLGVASEDTKGPFGVIPDEANGLSAMGLTDD
ncbi:hypothetical protein QE385_003266 [Sphingomonas sp. SORGH_AS 950]|nr:benenodin family lasso peptide [Sphingomonas sp. SORGH_AS_0950]MDQ1158939.1 hypothetical protein [Sphingomonas sp. SORGH_AS_0950]